jgi:hypothetical protein
MSNILGRRVFDRLLALLLFENVLIIAAVAFGVWLRLGQDAWLVLWVEGGLRRRLSSRSRASSVSTTPISTIRASSASGVSSSCARSRRSAPPRSCWP